MRGGVDEAATGRNRGLETFRRSGRCDQVHGIKVIVLARSCPALGFFREKIGNDAAQTTRRRELLGKLFRTILQHWVPVGHHHGIATSFGDGPDHGDGVLDPETIAQRDIRRLLNGGAIHHGVGEGNAHLNEVSMLRQGLHQRE